MVFAVFFSHGVNESHQNAKTASHDNASNRRAHRITPRGVLMVLVGFLQTPKRLRLFRVMPSHGCSPHLLTFAPIVRVSRADLHKNNAVCSHCVNLHRRDV